MNFEDAANILDPETSLDTLNKIKYYAGFRGEDAVQEAVTEACRIAAKILRNLKTSSDNSYIKHLGVIPLDQLRAMSKKVVFVDIVKKDFSTICDLKSQYGVVIPEEGRVRLFNGRSVFFTSYGAWIAYKDFLNSGD